MSCALIPSPSGISSPLMLADQLLTIAAESDRAGFKQIAERVLGLVYDVLDAAVLPADAVPAH